MLLYHNKKLRYSNIQNFVELSFKGVTVPFYKLKQNIVSTAAVKNCNYVQILHSHPDTCFLILLQKEWKK
jgi:hypothetical protein